jgi:hypothetical protein
MKFHLMLTTEPNIRYLEKVIYCDPTQEQLNEFVMALLKAIDLLRKK